MPKHRFLPLFLLVATQGVAFDWLGESLAIVPDVYVAGPSMEPDPAAAADVFSSAKTAAESGKSATVFALSTEAVRLDPALAAGRRLLGYVSVDGQWMTPHQARMHKRGYAWSDNRGWYAKRDESRYESGRWKVGRRWVDAATDAQLHSTIDQGWQIRTDHFVVQTNHSRAAGAKLAAELEALWQAWRQMFAGYWLDPDDAKRLIAGEQPRRRSTRLMRVFYHRDKEGYVAHLRRRQPRIGQTLGIYFDDRREAHFYHADDPVDAELLRATLYHEAAHQFFAETPPGRVGAGRDANFWLVEGVACYFEMLCPVEGEARFRVGDPAQGRLPSAVARGPVVPLAELAALGQSDFQRGDNLAALYAQSAGVVTMLRHGAAADPPALDRLLRSVYGGRPDRDELTRQTGRAFSELEAEYRRFLANLSR